MLQCRVTASSPRRMGRSSKGSPAALSQAYMERVFGLRGWKVRRWWGNGKQAAWFPFTPPSFQKDRGISVLGSQWCQHCFSCPGSCVLHLSYKDLLRRFEVCRSESRVWSVCSRTPLSPLLPGAFSPPLLPNSLFLCISHSRSKGFQPLTDSWSDPYSQILPSWTFRALLHLKDSIHKRYSEVNDVDQNKRITIFNSKPNKSTLFFPPHASLFQPKDTGIYNFYILLCHNIMFYILSY